MDGRAVCLAVDLVEGLIELHVGLVAWPIGGVAGTLGQGAGVGSASRIGAMPAIYPSREDGPRCALGRKYSWRHKASVSAVHKEGPRLQPCRNIVCFQPPGCRFQANVEVDHIEC